jgi:hypothetical protein
MVSPGPSCLVHPSFTRLGGTKINTWVQQALFPEDLARQKAHRACSERLQSQRLKRLVEGDPELVCSRAAGAEMPSPIASALAYRDILHPLQVSFLRKEWGKACS